MTVLASLFFLWRKELPWHQTLCQVTLAEVLISKEDEETGTLGNPSCRPDPSSEPTSQPQQRGEPRSRSPTFESPQQPTPESLVQFADDAVSPSLSLGSAALVLAAA